MHREDKVRRGEMVHGEDVVHEKEVGDGRDEAVRVGEVREDLDLDDDLQERLWLPRKVL